MSLHPPDLQEFVVFAENLPQVLSDGYKFEDGGCLGVTEHQVY